jgi:hypothetical protein
MPGRQEEPREGWPLWKEFLAKFKSEYPEEYREFVRVRLQKWRHKPKEHYNAKQNCLRGLDLKAPADFP